MADEATLDSEMTSELEALLGNKEPAAPAAAAGKAGEQAPPVASPEAPKETPTGDEDPLLKALDELEEEAKPDDGKPSLNDEQKTILELIPDAKTAENLYGVVQNYETFTGALAGGKFEDVEAMLTEWNPDVLDKWLDHIYEKNKVEFVDRFIRENDPEAPKENKELTKLQKEVNLLKNSLTEKKQMSEKDAEQLRVQQSFKAYNDHVNEMFDKINFSKADRRWVKADLDQRVIADPKITAELKKGNTKAVVPLFKAAIREYANRDKEVTTAVEKKIETQEKKKLPLGGAGGVESEAIPDDIRQVKKGDEDKWMENQLTSFLASSLGKKK